MNSCKIHVNSCKIHINSCKIHRKFHKQKRRHLNEIAARFCMRDCGEILHACISDEIAARFCMHEMSTLEAPFFERKFFRHAPHVAAPGNLYAALPACSVCGFFARHASSPSPAPIPAKKPRHLALPMLPQTLTCIDVHVLAEKK